MRVFLAAVVLLCGIAVPVEAVSLKDLIGLSKQGISDDILIALVEAEKSVFHITASDLKPLKDAGLSDRLVIHLLQTPSRPAPEVKLHLASEPAPAPAAARHVEPEPRVVYVERVETVGVPVYIPVPRADHDDRDERRDRPKPAEPVYWGYGGKLRPDAWKPAPVHPKKSGS